MPISVKMYGISQYPASFPVSSAEVSPGYANVNFKTLIEHLGKSEYTEIELDKYLVSHETGEKFEGHGWLEDGSSYDLIAVSSKEKFPCFIESQEYLYTSYTQRAISEQAISRMKKFPKPDNKLIANPVKINLISLKEYLQDNEAGDIKGGWFRGMKVANVEVAYLGGGSVTESEDWEKYEASGGSISALRIDIPTADVEEETIKLLLTKDGNCVVYKKFGELELFRIVIPLFRIAKQFIEK